MAEVARVSVEDLIQTIRILEGYEPQLKLSYTKNTPVVESAQDDPEPKISTVSTVLKMLEAPPQMLLLPPSEQKQPVTPEHHVDDFEKARLRHDRFLPMQKRKRNKRTGEPKLPGPPPVAKEHVTHDSLEDHECIGEHHDDGEQVLYHQMEFNGQFSFRDTILDQLERYFVYLKRLKKYDSESFRFYKQVGAHIVPYSSTGVTWKRLEELKAGITRHTDYSEREQTPLPTWIKEHRPGFGCVVFGAHPFAEQEEEFTFNGKKLWIPRFLSFAKYAKQPHCIEPTHDGDIYRVTIHWDKEKDDTNARQDFAVFVSRDGSIVKALKVLKTEIVHIRGKRGRPNSNIPRTGFRIPECYDSWAKDHNVTTERFLVDLFCQSMDAYVNANASMVRIAVLKDDLTAVFGVDVERLPYFFRDRDRVVGLDGKLKRIFHYVRPHTRSDGSIVGSHFRGCPDFKLGPYEVRISVPGYDHASLLDLEIGHYDFVPGSSEPLPSSKVLTSGRMAQILKEYLDGTRHGNWR
jgi:hypothetical protein